MTKETWVLMIGGRFVEKGEDLNSMLKKGIGRTKELLPSTDPYIMIGDNGDWSIRVDHDKEHTKFEIATVYLIP